MHILVLLIAYFSRSKKNGDVFIPPHPDRSKTGVPYAKMGTGWAEADTIERAVNYSNRS